MSASVTVPRRVTVFALGGTIAMSATGRGGVVPALSAEQLVSSVPGLADLELDIDVVNFRQLPGASLAFDDLAQLADAIQDCFTAGVDGLIITQGTDTIEETAYALDLAHAGPQPIVVTGAMRNPTLAGADGPANLLAAMQAAASPAARDLGCLVVLADEIHAARRVRKTHATNGATFQSPNGGPLGYVIEGRPRLLNALTHRTPVPRQRATRRPSVALVTMVLSDDGLLLHGLADRADAAVIAGFGVGHVPQHLVAPMEHLATRIPVVLASRTGAGSVLAHTYGFPGSEHDLLNRGLIGAGFLDAYKARILLHAALTAGADRDTIAAAFGVAGGYAEPGTWPWPNITGSTIGGSAAYEARD